VSKYLDEKIDEVVNLTIKMKKSLLHNCNYEDGSSISQIETLHCLVENPRLAMKDVAEHLGITMPSATSIVARLVKQNFIIRIYDAKDRRIIRLKITELGLAELIKRQKFIREKIAQMFTKLSEQELEELIRLEQKVLE